MAIENIEDFKKEITSTILELEEIFRNKIKSNTGDFNELRNEGYKEGIKDFKEILERKLGEDDLGENSDYF